MIKSSKDETSSSEVRAKDRKRQRERSPSSPLPTGTYKNVGSTLGGDSAEVRPPPGSLMEALLKSREKVDSNYGSEKKKTKKKKKERSASQHSRKEATVERTETAAVKKSFLDPATVAGAAKGELNLTLKKEDLQDNYDTDEEDEIREHALRCNSQLVKMVGRRTREYEGPARWDHAATLARFEREVREDITRRRMTRETIPPLQTPTLHATCKCTRTSKGSDWSTSASEGGEVTDNSDDGEEKKQREKRRKASMKKRNKKRKTKQSEAAMTLIKQEVDWRRLHPSALSKQIVFNVPDMLNESPACRCSSERKQEGVRHNYYLGETKLASTVESCAVSALHHYVLSVNPSPSKQMKKSTEMRIHGEGMDAQPFHFEGFSILSHRSLPPLLPPEPQHKWTDEYRFALEQDENLSEQTVGSVRALDSLFSYITEDILELFDLRRWPEEVEMERRSRRTDSERFAKDDNEQLDGCPIFHVLPRFVRMRLDGSTELAPISAVLDYIREAYTRPFCTREESEKIHRDSRAFEAFKEGEMEGIVIDAAKRPSSLRVDEVNRSETITRDWGIDGLPVITHHAWRPTSFLLAARPDYQASASRLKEMKSKLLAGTEPAKRINDGGKDETLAVKRFSLEEENLLRKDIADAEQSLQKLKNECMNQREVQISLSSKQFKRTGFKADLAQHAILLVMTMNHVRFHWALEMLEERVGYKFEDRTLLELALSHPAYNANYGTNPDHARNAINLCGIRQSGSKSRQHLNGLHLHPDMLDLKNGRNRRKDIDQLVELSEAQRGAKKVQLHPSTINERLEFLGDSVVEMIVTVHLFFLLPSHDEGALATFRSALVQNKNLAALAREIYLDKFLLMSHGVELLHEPEYRHATANSFEAFMAAVYLDSGKRMEHCERIYGNAMYGKDSEALKVWNALKEHELQADFPGSDRHLVSQAVVLQKLEDFEKSIGLKFAHITLLARAFTRRSSSANTLTKGDHQSLELLGDTILQMCATDFLYRAYPTLHEGHLSQLRTCLVSNNTQSWICDDLDMTKYVVDFSLRKKQNATLKTKDKADLVEALLGAIYVDRGWEYCRAFTRVCFFPRTKFFIDNHAWADAKSALQQICLALPRLGTTGGKKLMPEYKLVAESGPTNSREYTIACTFRGQRIGEATANTMHNAEMNAAQEGLRNLPKFFPEDWDIYEQKKRRVSINRGAGREKGVSDRSQQQRVLPRACGSSTSRHVHGGSPPLCVDQTPAAAPTVTPQLLPPYRGGGLFNSFSSFHPLQPAYSSKPMNLMSIDLQTPRLQWPQTVGVTLEPSSSASSVRNQKKSKRERNKERKRKMMEIENEKGNEPSAAHIHPPDVQPLSRPCHYSLNVVDGNAACVSVPPHTINPRSTSHQKPSVSSSTHSCTAKRNQNFAPFLGPASMPNNTHYPRHYPKVLAGKPKPLLDLSFEEMWSK